MNTFLFFIIIITFLDTFIQLPIISTYSQEVGASSMLTGMTISVYSLTNMIGNAVSGYYIDRYGRKKLLLTGMALVAVILLFYPMATSGESLFFIRLIHGFAGGAMIPAAFAYLGDISPKTGNGKTMAYSGAGIGIAAIIGPAAGGILSANISVEAVFYFTSALFFLTSAAVAFRLKESFQTGGKSVVTAGFRNLLTEPLMHQAILSAFALMASMGTLTFALPLKMAALSYSSSITGALLSSFGIVAIFIFLTPGNRLYDKVQAQTLIIFGLFFIGSALLALGFVDSLPATALAMVIYGIGFSFIFPSMNKMVVEVSTKNDRGKAFGLFYAGFSLGVVFGSLLSGVIADIYGKPFLISSALIFTFFLLFLILVKRHSFYLKMK
ncbi:Predicted arabinose efflux permease, MFS family [Evansella caseinilytica]|uniref:Predicted arabinose efflux permease, MFS family n=1 Tax=Evansella caseinilytica TaxID=1503961 RepID=A0A1H3UB47_9BACI|nr:MFS transporter [Evansella caseinilytica]SDZ58809.1 Predicted arabinose efflux permease, MFS family [Evansella caseinilytica]